MNTAATAQAALEVDRVTLALGGREILNDASFTVRNGEFIGVLGPNGAGKTTLMRALLGLVPLKSGSIRVNGEAVVRGNPSIGYMPQIRTGLANRRVLGRDFVAMAADGHHWGLPHRNARIRADVERVLELVGARQLASRPLSELSGASVSGCCSRSVCSAIRACCCWTNRSSVSIRGIRRAWSNSCGACSAS